MNRKNNERKIAAFFRKAGFEFVLAHKIARLVVFRIDLIKGKTTIPARVFMGFDMWTEFQNKGITMEVVAKEVHNATEHELELDPDPRFWFNVITGTLKLGDKKFEIKNGDVIFFHQE